jgi:PadR family transcriptional regulator, regulatory protein PadR
MSGMVEAGVDGKRDSDLLRGVLDMCVLGVLATRPAHAYEVVERLRLKGFEAVGYGTIYPLVTRLRRQGLVEQRSVASPVGPTRKVLAVTRSGREALSAWRARWERSIAAAERVMSELDNSLTSSRD